MFFADMIIDCILDDLDAFLMSCIAECEIPAVTSKAFVHFVVIGEPVSMVTRYFISALLHPVRVILNDRGQPKSSHAQLLKIIEMIFYSLEISTMPGPHICPVACLVAVAGHDVIGRIAV